MPHERNKYRLRERTKAKAKAYHPWTTESWEQGKAKAKALTLGQRNLGNTERTWKKIIEK